MTTIERIALEQRRDELSPMMASFVETDEADKVHLALSDMFGSFRSMRQTGEEALAVLDASSRALAKFPSWAIVKACLAIQTNGVWRDEKFDRRWPPSDAEIVHEVRSQLRLYGDAYRSAVALLEAEVEE